MVDVRTTSLKDDDPSNTDWQDEGGAIVCDIDTGIKVKYLYSVAVASIPNHIVKVIAIKLAETVCIPITNSKSLKEDLAIEYDRELKKASSLDAGQGRTRVIRSSGLVDVSTTRSLSIT